MSLFVVCLAWMSIVSLSLQEMYKKVGGVF